MDRSIQYKRYVGRKFERYGEKYIVQQLYKPGGNMWYFKCVNLDDANSPLDVFLAHRLIQHVNTRWVDSLFDKYKANLLKE